MICQNMVWLTWPPPLFWTTLRMSSGMAARSLIRSSADLRAELGVLVDGAVEVGDVGLVVLVVVELHGRLVDVGFEGGVVVGQRGKFEGHGDSPVLDWIEFQGMWIEGAGRHRAFSDRFACRPGPSRCRAGDSRYDLRIITQAAIHRRLNRDRLVSRGGDLWGTNGG